MTESRYLVARPLRSGGTGSQGSESRSLPADIVQAASRRVGVAVLSIGAVWVVALGIIHGLLPALGIRSSPPVLQVSIVAGALSVAASIGFFALSRSSRVSPLRLLSLALVYEVLIAFGIGVLNNWPDHRAIFAGTSENAPAVYMDTRGGFMGIDAEPRHAYIGRGLSWVCIVILFFPVLIPSSRRRTAVTAFAAASMDPVGFYVATLVGGPTLPFPLVVARFFPNYICAALALVIVGVINFLGRKVRHARRLGAYELVERIGTGGMGEVWRARHQLLARPAAVKVIRAEMLGTGNLLQARTLLKRFEREAQATACLTSPHTIEIYDFGATDEGSFYYVMEFLDGLDLETLVQRHGPLPPERTIHILRQCCHSLAEAHAQGLVHRDVKPANIYVGRRGLDEDFVKVLDFGLVKAVGDHPGPQSLVTANELIAGTPAFMAPELAMRQDAVDPRVDIYALGCVGYFLVTGQLVFEGDTPMNVIIRHVNDPPIPPSRRTEIRVPGDLEEIILACLDKDPLRRPASALELDRRLGACEAAAAWTNERARRWWELHSPRDDEAAGRRAHAERTADLAST